MNKECSVLNIFLELNSIMRDWYYCSSSLPIDKKERLNELLAIWCEADCDDICDNSCLYGKEQSEWILMLKHKNLFELLNEYCTHDDPGSEELIPRSGGEITGNPVGRMPGSFGSKQ